MPSVADANTIIVAAGDAEGEEVQRMGRGCIGAEHETCVERSVTMYVILPT